MTTHLTVSHTHEPIYRVVRAGWADPLDASFSQLALDNRWNTFEFPALYCCCGLPTARAVTRDVLRFAGVEVEDLQPAFRPRLVEVRWTGEVVDVASPAGVASAGLPPTYPDGVSKVRTREMATEWHDQGREGVVCRSASLWRMGLTDWSGDCTRTGEVVLFVENCRNPPLRTGHLDGSGWLKASP